MSTTAAHTMAPTRTTAARAPMRPKLLPAQLVSPLQRKPVIGAVDDPLEREADRAADAVIAGRLDMPITGTRPGMERGLAQRKCAACEEAEERGEETPCEHCSGKTIRRACDGGDRILPKADGALLQNGASEAAQAVATDGAPMSPDLRRYFEPRFGRDFGDVRLHTDAAASTASRAIHARAYTLGRDIAFGPGAYAPDSIEGRRLIAHELAHVAQQDGGLPVIRRQEEQGGPSPEATEADIKEPTTQELREAEIRESRASPGGVRTTIQPFRITLEDFAVDSSDLKKLHEGAVDELVDILKKAPAGNLRVVIVGHADETGADAHNLGLSRRRAEAAMRRLRRAGGTNVETLGLGEAQPAASNATLEGRKRNRRVEIFLLPGPSIKVKPEPEPEPEPQPVPKDDDTPVPPEDTKPPPEKTSPPPEKTTPPPPPPPPPDDSFCERHPIICGGVGVGVGVGVGLGVGILFCLANPLACVPIPGLPPILPGGGEPPGGEDPDKDPEKEKEKKKRKPKRACLVSSNLPSGHIKARSLILGANSTLSAPFDMGLTFSEDPETGCSCNCGEFRQEVKGTFERNMGSGWEALTHSLVHPAKLSSTTFQEDTHERGPYGRRYWDPLRAVPRPGREGDEFIPDSETGCTYSGSDSPGFPLAVRPPGSEYRFHLYFQGGAVDGCLGRAQMAGWHQWETSGYMKIPGSPPPTPDPDPDPVIPPPAPAPQIDPAPYKGPSMGPAPSGPTRRVKPDAGALCVDNNIGCRTADFIFDHHGLLMGDQRDQAIDFEFQALWRHCKWSESPLLLLNPGASIALLRNHAERRVAAFLAWGMLISQHSVGPPCP